MEHAAFLSTPYPGFADPVLHAQQAFRAALNAMAYPRRVQRLTSVPDAPPSLCAAGAALALALCDFETPVWVDDAAAASLGDYLRFHCGCPLVAHPHEAVLALITHAPSMPDLMSFGIGESESPHHSATLLIQVESLERGQVLFLRGPGIADVQALTVTGLPSAFGDWWRNNACLFPQGVDVLLVSGSSLAGLPRSTRLDG